MLKYSFSEEDLSTVNPLCGAKVNLDAASVVILAALSKIVD